MIISDILAATTFITMLPVLAAVLFIAYMHKRDFLRSTGFGGPEVGMILVGSMFGIITDIPVIVAESALLNINLGGALIPVIVCGSLIYSKRLNLIKISLGVIMISVLAFYITRFEPTMGIVAEFPYFLMPSALGIGLAFVFERMGETRIPYAYSVSVLGTLIGADLVRIPLLVQEGVFGSIGGAGAMDLVYLSGLMAAVPLVAFYYFRYPKTRAEDPMDESRKMLRSGHYKESIDNSIYSVDRELKKASRLVNRDKLPWLGLNPDIDVMVMLGLHPMIIGDYTNLLKARLSITPTAAYKAFYTSKLLQKAIKTGINEKYTSMKRRMAAYIIDVLFTTVPIILAIFYLFISVPTYTEVYQYSSLFLALISLLISIQFIYFTIAEWLFGTTIGKALLGLRVVSDDFHKLNFIQSAARNSARYADILLFFYFVSIVLMMSGPERKRIGDHVGGTRVVKIK